MSVLLNTSAGDIVIDLYSNECPLAAKNFLKLCSIKYYNNCLVYNIQSNYILQTGDPTGTGLGGSSVYGILNGIQDISFNDEIIKTKKLNRVGLVGMAHHNSTQNSNRSQFFITLRGEDMQFFEGTHTIFGEVAEGLDVLEKLNTLYCDEDGRPYQDVRIKHTYILDDPFPDPDGLLIPISSPNCEYPKEEKVKKRISFEEKLGDEIDIQTSKELEESIRRKEAKSRAIVLEMTGDLPDADVKPPDEVLFVCKLNAVTTSEDLELIFSRFGIIKSCEVIRDFKTGDSLNYAFIEFESEAACIEAYEKMNNVLIDDRRIKVDFSQSVSKLWNRFLLEPKKAVGMNTMKSKPIENTSSIAAKATTSHYQRQSLPSNKDQPHINKQMNINQTKIIDRNNSQQYKDKNDHYSNNKYTDNHRNNNYDRKDDSSSYNRYDPGKDSQSYKTNNKYKESHYYSDQQTNSNKSKSHNSSNNNSSIHRSSRSPPREQQQHMHQSKKSRDHY